MYGFLKTRKTTFTPKINIPIHDLAPTYEMSS